MSYLYQGVSVVLPVYNGEKYLREAIESILSQSLYNIELVIINDGSVDQSETIIKEFSIDKRVRLVNKENSGIVDSLNLGLELASFPLVARMDADDIAREDRLEKQLQAFNDDKHLSVLGSDIVLMDHLGQNQRLQVYPRYGSELDDKIEQGSPLAHPAVMMKKSDVQRVGGYRKLFTHAEDYDLWLRMYSEGLKLDNYPEPLLYYRQNQEGISCSNVAQQMLVTTVAHLCCLMKRDGLEEPLLTDDKIAISTLDKIPSKYLPSRKKAELEIQYYGGYKDIDANNKYAIISKNSQLLCELNRFRNSNSIFSFIRLCLAAVKNPIFLFHIWNQKNRNE